MLYYQGGVEEELLSEGGLNVSDGFPVGRTEVDPECKAYLEEQVVRQDVQKGARHIEVMLDLVEARFDVIGVDNDVVIRV